MNKKLFNLFLICLAIWGVTWKVYAKEVNDNTRDNKTVIYTLSSTNKSSYSVLLEDNANLLTDEEEKKLREQMMALSGYGNIAFKTIDNNPWKSVDSFAKNYYRDHFGNKNGVLFLIDIDTREIYIFFSGNSYRAITKDKISSITNNVYKYAEEGNYYLCASEIFKRVNDLLEGSKITNENNYSVVLEDDANLLASEEKKKLKEQMMALSGYGNIGFITTYVNPREDAASLAEEYYRQYFGNTSGVLLLIDMDTREVYLYSRGNLYRTITTAKAYSITDNVYKYAKEGDYYSCASVAFKQVNDLLEGRKIAEPMRIASNVFVAIAVAFLINFLYVLFKSRLKKADAEEIIKNCNINFKVSDVNAFKNGTCEVYSPVSKSSGGSSGGGSFGGGGGGGFSGGGGGGGGHRF